MRSALVAGWAVVLGCAVASVVVFWRQAAPPVARQPGQVKPEAASAPARHAKVSEPAPALPEPPPPEAPEPRSAATRPDPEAAHDRVENTKPQPVNPTPPAKDAAVQDPVARFALQFVGMDPDAGEYWAEAINHPGLSAHERQDLIEDLNEDGFPDPENPTRADLPLILNRIAIIEALAPYAMDSVNADAFQEAGKDLVNMGARALRTSASGQ
jgi:hypothetical protein